MALTDQAPRTQGHTWTVADYAIRDAQLAALGVRSFRKDDQMPTAE
ncbi:MAG: hypothetical protein ACLQUY_07960 [Ktedonobacterales bacterium]